MYNNLSNGYWSNLSIFECSIIKGEELRKNFHKKTKNHIVPDLLQLPNWISFSEWTPVTIFFSLIEHNVFHMSTEKKSPEIVVMFFHIRDFLIEIFLTEVINNWNKGIKRSFANRSLPFSSNFSSMISLETIIQLWRRWTFMFLLGIDLYFMLYYIAL